jgi:hypothetical protein
MAAWVQELISKWEAEGVKINDGASLEEIKSTETILEFEFPDDFKEFYLQINGFKGLDWQEHMFYFWPLERIIEENDKLSDFVSFCDFLLASHYIGFKRNRTEIFKMYSISNRAEDNPIAQTFEEVVNLINTNSHLIY